MAFELIKRFPRLSLPQIKTICDAYRIRSLVLFGSAVRDDFSPDSDVDILVYFQSGERPGLKFVLLQDELSDALGRQVDLVEPGAIRNPYRLKSIFSKTEPLYVAE